MDRVKKALDFHAQGYNCAQAVACAFDDIVDIDIKTIFKMAEAFGGGMGTEGTCGAVSGMAMIIGMKTSDGNIESPSTKLQSYDKIGKATEKFINMNSSSICKEIRYLPDGEKGKRCNDYIACAVRILEEMI